MQKFIIHKNAQLSYHVYGNGKVLVLLHGFAETNTVWKNQVGYLSNYCKLIVPDLPGSGSSEALNIKNEDSRVDDFADAVHSIIMNENSNNCIMAGHSFGGYITLAFAEKYSDVLSAFGFVHSTAFADSNEKKQTRIKAIRIMDEYGSYAFLKTATPTLFSNKYKLKQAAEINRLVEEGKSFEPKNLIQYYYAMMNRSCRTHVLKANKIPVLFIAGTEDVAVPLNDVLKQVHMPEISYFHLLKNVGHMGMWEAAEKVNEVLKQFVDEV